MDHKYFKQPTTKNAILASHSRLDNLKQANLQRQRRAPPRPVFFINLEI